MGPHRDELGGWGVARHPSDGRGGPQQPGSCLGFPVRGRRHEATGEARPGAARGVGHGRTVSRRMRQGRTVASYGTYEATGGG
ncbi:unnamed protein product [Calypogeia fissa]